MDMGFLDICQRNELKMEGVLSSRSQGQWSISTLLCIRDDEEGPDKQRIRELLLLFFYWRIGANVEFWLVQAFYYWWEDKLWLSLRPCVVDSLGTKKNWKIKRKKRKKGKIFIPLLGSQWKSALEISFIF